MQNYKKLLYEMENLILYPDFVHEYVKKQYFCSVVI